MPSVARFCHSCTCKATPPTSVHKGTLDSFARAEYWSQLQAPTERRSNSRFLYIDGADLPLPCGSSEKVCGTTGHWSIRFHPLFSLCVKISLKTWTFLCTLSCFASCSSLCRICSLIITELYMGQQESNSKLGVGRPLRDWFSFSLLECNEIQIWPVSNENYSSWDFAIQWKDPDKMEFGILDSWWILDAWRWRHS